MPVIIDGSSGITTPTYGGADTSEYLVPVTQFKNRIINGAMVIDQRNAGASITPTTSGTFSVDRWSFNISQSSKFSAQQNAGSVTPPTGFTNYLGTTSLSAYSITSTDYFNFLQTIEGFNCADLGWGTANAKTVTLSFWARSSLTGTFGGVIQNHGGTRFYPFAYTISSANTWEYKTVTITGDTTGTWPTNNDGSVQVRFSIGTGAVYSGTAGSWSGTTYASVTGAVSVVGTNGATWYITGVQLEVGSTATSFDYRPYGTELQLCQRYCRTLISDSGTDKAMFSGVCFTTGTAIYSYTFPTMRVAPAATVTNATSIDVVYGNAVSTTNNTLAFSEFTPNSCQPSTTNSGLIYAAGNGAVARFDGAAVVFSAEL